MHCDSHLHFDALDDPPAAVVDRAVAAGVTHMVAIGGDEEADRFALEVARTHPAHVRATAGYDRDRAGSAVDVDALRTRVAEPEVVAVGETGLDYHYEPDSAPAQCALFEAMLDVAAQAGKPVVVHSRDADDDTLALLRAYAAVWRGAAGQLGVLHCFTRSLRFARAVLDLGLYVSFSGIVTFRNAPDLRDVAAMVPLERMLIETDAPYLAPVPHRGRRNEPALVPHVAACIADVRGVAPDVVAEHTRLNALALFNWN